MAITQECCEQSWTSPGGNTPQDTNCTATCLLSRKLTKLDKPDMQDTAGEAGTNSWVMYSYGPPHMAEQKQDDQHEHTFSNYVRVRDVAQKTCQRRWTIGKSGERGSGISVLPARHNDDDDPEYLARETIPIFIPLIRFLRYLLVSCRLHFLMRYFFKCFLSSSLVWLCQLPIYQSICRFPFFFFFEGSKFFLIW